MIVLIIPYITSPLPADYAKVIGTMYITESTKHNTSIIGSVWLGNSKDVPTVVGSNHYALR